MSNTAIPMTTDRGEMIAALQSAAQQVGSLMLADLEEHRPREADMMERALANGNAIFELRVRMPFHIELLLLDVTDNSLVARIGEVEQLDGEDGLH